MAKQSDGVIRVGVGGWAFEPWRGSFYPDDLPQKRELEYASRKFSTIEINSTYYGSQKPESFAKWRDEAPGDFVFAVKGPRFATNRKVLAEAGESIQRFFASGVLELREKLGPVNWQFATSKKFDPADFGAFFKLLPGEVAGRAIRHAVEVRHESLKSAEFVELARKHGVAIVIAGESEFPQIADVTAPFVYVRIMGAIESEKFGYSRKVLDAWAAHAGDWASGAAPKGLATLLPPKTSATRRDVFLYAISGFKQKNPAAAIALIERCAR